VLSAGKIFPALRRLLSVHALHIILNFGELTKTNRKDRLVIISPFGNIFVYSRKRIFWMSSSVRLTEEEKMEMLADARDPARRAAFAAAQGVSHRGTLDDYIGFLSENMGIAGESAPRIMKTSGYRL
jgi:hypothetical protein